MSLYPNWLVIEGRRYLAEQALIQPPAPRFRVAWDDESSEFGYRCRTQDPGFEGPTAPPAVWRYYPAPIDKMGDFRVNLEAWKDVIIAINGGDYQDWEYLVDPKRATYNTTGWPMQAYLTMSGNYLDGERFGDWLRFRTLIPSDVGRVAGWTHETHPEYIHKFTCVKWKDGETVHIESTGTNRGQVYFPLVSKEGYAYIPFRNIVAV